MTHDTPAAPTRAAAGPTRGSRCVRAARAAAMATCLLAACDTGPFEIEPRALAGDWAGSAGAASVTLRCAEVSDGSCGTFGCGVWHSLGCTGTFRDAARGIVDANVGGGTSANSRSRMEVDFGFAVSTNIRLAGGGKVVLWYEGQATDRSTIKGWLVEVHQRPTFHPNGAPGPEAITRADSTALTLRRQ